MKPSALKKGMAVRRKEGGPVYVFQFRHGKKCRCVCEEYKGLNGPDDDGRVDVSDWDMSRKYQQVHVPNDKVERCQPTDNENTGG